MIISTDIGMSAFIHAFWGIVWTDASLAARIFLISSLAVNVFFIIIGRGLERRYFGMQGILIVAVCFNPWLMYFICKYANLSSRYFRFLWLIPAGITWAWFLAKITGLLKGRTLTVCCGILAAAVLMAGSVSLYKATGRTLNETNQGARLQTISNKYRIENDTLQACTLIEEDKGDPQQAVKVLYDYYRYMDIRTYDASVCTDITAWEQSSNHNAGLTDEELWNRYKAADPHALLAYLINTITPPENITLPSEAIAYALHAEGYQYIIVRRGTEAEQLFLPCGDVLGLTDTCTVIRVSD